MVGVAREGGSSHEMAERQNIRAERSLDLDEDIEDQGAGSGNRASYVPARHHDLSDHPLREPGMSADEIARLEEEERRIDEAIAESERR